MKPPLCIDVGFFFISLRAAFSASPFFVPIVEFVLHCVDNQLNLFSLFDEVASNGNCVVLEVCRLV